MMLSLIGCGCTAPTPIITPSPEPTVTATSEPTATAIPEPTGNPYMDYFATCLKMELPAIDEIIRLLNDENPFYDEWMYSVSEVGTALLNNHANFYNLEPIPEYRDVHELIKYGMELIDEGIKNYLIGAMNSENLEKLNRAGDYIELGQVIIETAAEAFEY